jgi:hypothetical protein
MVLELIPLAAFVLAFAAGAVFLLVVFKTGRTSIRNDAVHIESALGTLDLQPNKQPDPELAAIPLYPGALRCEATEYQIDVSLGKKRFHTVSASYWTPDPVAQVWEFYRRELPQWRDISDETPGYELCDRTTGRVRQIHIYRKGDRTLLNTSIQGVASICLMLLSILARSTSPV